LFALTTGTACATAHNYLEPEGPRFAGGSASAAAPPDGDGALRVVTFNVAYAKQIPAAIAALRAEPLRGADVIALQEMDAPGSAAIAQALGFNYVYYPASRHPKTARDFGNAILSPWPIEESRKVLLPGVSRGSHQARAAVRASVRVGKGTVTVYSVHLTSPWGMGGGGRARQVDAILGDADGIAGPIVIAGDFNSHGVGERLVARGFLWPTRKVGRTIGPFSYDHVFVRGWPAGQPVTVGIGKAGPKASDHWPVWAVLPPTRESR
jgi:endonuclease/exonuclease/phosphatase family metal-dependent hydrolase